MIINQKRSRVSLNFNIVGISEENEKLIEISHYVWKNEKNDKERLR